MKTWMIVALVAGAGVAGYFWGKQSEFNAIAEFQAGLVNTQAGLGGKS
jgi:hypothetical protein